MNRVVHFFITFEVKASRKHYMVRLCDGLLILNVSNKAAWGSRRRTSLLLGASVPIHLSRSARLFLEESVMSLIYRVGRRTMRRRQTESISALQSLLQILEVQTVALLLIPHGLADTQGHVFWGATEAHCVGANGTGIPTLALLQRIHTLRTDKYHLSSPCKLENRSRLHCVSTAWIATKILL